MEMSHIGGYGETGEGVAGGSVWEVCRDSPDDLYPFFICPQENGTTTNPIYGNTIDQVRVLPILSADAALKETKSIRRECGEAEPADLGRDWKRSASRKKWKGIVWKSKHRRTAKDY